MLGRPVRSPITKRIVRHPTSKRPYRVSAGGSGDTDCACCIPTICFSLPCLTFVVSSIDVCTHILESFCLGVGSFPGGTFKAPLFSSDSNTCQWSGCYDGVGNDLTCQPRDSLGGCDSGAPIAHGCPQFIIRLTWMRDRFPNPFLLEIIAGNPYGGPSAHCAFAYFSAAFAGPLSDGLVIHNANPNTTCDPFASGVNPWINGTVTIKLKSDGSCTGTLPSPCEDIDCNAPTGCDCASSEIESGCTDPLPDSFEFDLSPLSLCQTDSDACDGVAACTLGAITMTKVVGATCASPQPLGPGSATYTGQINDADGNPCVVGSLIRNGFSWAVDFEDMRCGQIVLWSGYHVADTDGPLGDYTIYCFGACNGGNSNVCTLTATASCAPTDCSPLADSYTLTLAAHTIHICCYDGAVPPPWDCFSFVMASQTITVSKTSDCHYEGTVTFDDVEGTTTDPACSPCTTTTTNTGRTTTIRVKVDSGNWIIEFVEPGIACGPATYTLETLCNGAAPTGTYSGGSVVDA